MWTVLFKVGKMWNWPLTNVAVYGSLTKLSARGRRVEVKRSQRKMSEKGKIVVDKIADMC